MTWSALSPLEEHQVRAIEYLLKNPYSIIALDPGLGKSRVLIEGREKLQCRCVVICPSYLIQNWVKEIRKWAPPERTITVFDEGKKIRKVTNTDYVITSYDLAQKAPQLFEWADMIGLDEGHALKSMKAKRTQFIHKEIYENSIKRVHILTGTPIKNRVQEFYSLLAICFYNPNAPDSRFLSLYPSEIHFADKFSIREEYKLELPDGRRIPIVKWNGIKNIDELKKWLDGKYIRIRDTDIRNSKPVRYKAVQVADMNQPELLGAFTQHFENEDAGSVKPDIKLQAAEKKVPFTIKYVENLLEEVDCLLVYSDHVAPAQAIAKHFDTRAICGSMPAGMRSKMADEFQAGKGRILVATIGSLKEGKDLFRASHIVFNDYCWTPGDLKQVIKRIDRMGQKNTCTVHKILGSPQDSYISEVLEEKIKTIDKAT
jgi:SNF2 family DNA or RNA helicase